MGAEQSVVGHQKSSSIQQNLHTTVLSPTSSSSSHSKPTKQTGHSSSVPSSPHYDWRRQSFTGPVVNNTTASNSNSQLVPSNRQQQSHQKQQRTSLSSLSKDVTISQSSFLFPSTASIVEPCLSQSHRSLSTKSLNYSLDKSTGTSTSHKHSSGILVVNRGRYASSQYELNTCGDVISSYSNNNNNSSTNNYYTDIGISQLKKLQRISTFEPLLSVNSGSNTRGGGVDVKTPSSSSHSTTTTTVNKQTTSTGVNTQSSTGFRKKQFIPHIPEFECDELIQLSLTYEEYLHKYATEVSQKQSDIITIQNKLDRDVCQLSESLEAREKGIITGGGGNGSMRHSTSLTFRSPFNSPKKINPNLSESNSSRKQKLAGSQQIETIVLLTSQISGLMSQCDELCKHLMSTINNLNETLSNYESNLKNT